MKRPEHIQEHPIKRHLENQLIFHKRKLECLQKRLVLIDENKASKSEHQKNEDELLKIETILNIETLQKIIGEREGYYVSYAKKFIADMEDMDNNIKSVIEKAKKKNDEQTKIALNKICLLYTSPSPRD